ncbi:MAG: arginine--tRNA ligase [Proteobacteria bacterium]|nr:arginine--tRNA ligase [Pseudomonadota bacterium]
MKKELINMVYIPLHEKLFEKIKAAVLYHFKDQVFDFSKCIVEPTKDQNHGDLATNCAMVLSSSIKMAPKQFAEKIVSTLKKDPDISDISIAGPGFINVTFKKEVWERELKTILTLKDSFGESKAFQNKTVNVEFVSANPTGPLHAGHGRNAILGDVVASLLKKVGYTVVREYYINDAGGQVEVLAESAYLRYLEACGKQVNPEDFSGKYPGDYLIPVAQKLKDLYNDQFVNQDKSAWGPAFKQKTIELMLEAIQSDLQSLGVEMDVYTSEKNLAEKGLIDTVLNVLTEKGDIYQGVLDKPKGHEIEDWEERPQTLFKSTEYGDDTDRALQKSDGSWTYFAGDLAYHYFKLNRKFDRLINIFGADHVGYITRLKAGVFALSNKDITFDIKSSQMVNFLDNGVPVRMSKRAGTFVTLRDVIDRVGKDATRFMMVSRHQDMPIDFDFVKVIEESKDNPIFYIQYANARIHSVLRHATQLGYPSEFDCFNFSYLKEDAELNIIKQLSLWPRTIDIAVKNLEPHRIANYLYQLASSFHSLWNLGKEDTTLRFIDEKNKDQTFVRLALISAVAIIIESGLKLLGITPLKEMR